MADKQLCIIFRDVNQIDSAKITNQKENELSNCIWIILELQ
jgi:hypothetical protein